jgi:hypothetical protein
MELKRTKKQIEIPILQIHSFEEELPYISNTKKIGLAVYLVFRYVDDDGNVIYIDKVEKNKYEIFKVLGKDFCTDFEYLTIPQCILRYPKIYQMDGYRSDNGKFLCSLYKCEFRYIKAKWVVRKIEYITEKYVNYFKKLGFKNIDVKVDNYSDYMFKIYIFWKKRR